MQCIAMRPSGADGCRQVTMVPLETVRGVYEKLSREAVEAQLTRPSPGRRVHSNGYHGDEEAWSSDVVTEEMAGKKGVLERTAAGMNGGGRATSAPTTPAHRPSPSNADTCRDVIAGGDNDDELPQRGLTQALVAQWRELEERARAAEPRQDAGEERARAERKAGASRSRSLSGLALRRAAGESPSPSRGRAEQVGPCASVDVVIERLKTL